jgi:hypothetical protein
MTVEEASLTPEVPTGIDGVFSCFAYADPKVRILTASYKYRSATAFESAPSTLLHALGPATLLTNSGL